MTDSATAVCAGKIIAAPLRAAVCVRRRAARAGALLPIVLSALFAALVSGCMAMADPDGTGMPWNGPADWEGSSLPARMLER